MAITRREFAALAAAGAAASALNAIPSSLFADEPTKSSIKAIAFDAFPIFDPRPVFALAEHLFPGKGAALSDEWRTRQFEYCWLRATAKQYADFWQVTQDALVFAANKLKLELGPPQRDELMHAFLKLKTWPDVLPALHSLRQSGLRLTFLSNFTREMLDACIKTAGLDGLFDHVLSTDQARTYKPDPRAYKLATDALKLKREQILFAAHAGWDGAGAKWFGYPTFWVNRMKLPMEELHAPPDASGETLDDVVRFLN